MASFNVDLTLLPANSKVKTNANNGFYIQGKPFDEMKKLQVASVYQRHNTAATAEGREVNISAVAREAGVSRKFVCKVKAELGSHGHVVTPPPPNSSALRKKGVGAYCLTAEDEGALLGLMFRNPFRTRRNYIIRLSEITGAEVSESTISRFFLRGGFPYKGSMRKPDLIPRDKFKPDNIARYHQYIHWMKQIDPRRLKFGDEKLLKGNEVYNKKGRRNVITGEVPEFIVNSDFRNTYAIIGFCGIDRETRPVSFVIHDEKNNAVSFSEAIMEALAEGFLRRGDVLVLDNSAIHFKGENDGLIEWLWEEEGIAVIPLPTRAPELNPKELMWRNLTMKLRSSRVTSESHATAKLAHRIMLNFTHESTEAAYRQCGYIH